MGTSFRGTTVSLLRVGVSSNLAEVFVSGQLKSSYIDMRHHVAVAVIDAIFATLVFKYTKRDIRRVVAGVNGEAVVVQCVSLRVPAIVVERC